MLNPGFITRKALAEWQDTPVFLPQFQFHEKHRTIIHTTSPEIILPLIAQFDVQQDAVIRRLMSLRKIPQKFMPNQQLARNLPPKPEPVYHLSQRPTTVHHLRAPPQNRETQPVIILSD
jgi:hypothetical protein